MRLGVFGGSFDPIHHAHLIIAQLAREQLALDRVHFVVANAQPFKQGQHAAPAAARVRMVELAVASVPGFVVDPRELERPGPSYTVDTLESMVAEFRGAELVLLLGADAARGFEGWRNPDRIRALARIAVYPRGADEVPEGFEVALTGPRLELSATAIRARMAAQRSLVGWVPERVGDYISGLQLYRSDTG
ncbi:MAG: nicotinate (nicotinamide) nucleotide adenylyltransferase [Gemmatimonadota bacterium]